MCELLIRLIDKPLSGDSTVDCGRTRRGDVVSACPDGWEWSAAERSNPAWIIVKIPAMGLAEGVAAASPQPYDATHTYTWKRYFTYQLGQAPAGWQAALAYPRAAESFDLADLTTWRTLKLQRAPVVNPIVVGLQTSPNVIG
jgi:hypothetical protein